MRYTYQLQSESFSFGNPYPEDVNWASSMEDLKDTMREWAREHEHYGSDPSMASIWVCKGRHESIEYPDFILSIGPKGGIKKERV